MAEASKKKSSSKTTPTKKIEDGALDETLDGEDILDVAEPANEAVLKEVSTVEGIDEEKLEADLDDEELL
ncbi:MAG: hypothetical protein RSD38_04290, partial [Raoultibacter sp.]